MLKCLRELDLIRMAHVVIVFLPLIPANGGCHVKNSSKNPCNLMPRIGLVLWVSRVQVSHPCARKKKKMFWLLSYALHSAWHNILALIYLVCLLKMVRGWGWTKAWSQTYFYLCLVGEI